MAQVEIIKNNLITEKINTKNNNLKRVCAYARVSTDEEDQITSYKSQIEYYTEKIKSNPEWQFVGVYADEGISGTQIKHRVEFQRMIDDAKHGKIDIIITKSISRFARNTIDSLNTIRDLKSRGIDVHFEKEGLKTLDMDSEMFLTLYSAFAQAESESTSQNIKLGLKAKMKRGEPVGCARCYGYHFNKETKEFEIVEEEAKIIRMIFNWYADGLGSRVICNKLNSMGIKSPKGNKYQPETILSYINNNKYVGDLLQNKSYTESPLTHRKIDNYGEKDFYYVKDHHQGIVSRELWDRCQEISKKRRKKMINREERNHIEVYSRKYPFSSKIKCACCGKNYVRKTSNIRRNGTRTYWWTCGTRLKYHDEKGIESCSCSSITLQEKVLEDIFVKVYNNLIKKKYNTKDKLLNAIKEVISTTDVNSKLEQLNNERDLLLKRLSSLIDMKLDNIDNQEIYVEKENELNANIKKLNKEIDGLEIEKYDNKDIAKKLVEIEKIIDDNDKPLKEFNKTLFENLVDQIIVGEYDENNDFNPYAIRILLKTGREFEGELIKNNNSIGGVSFVKDKRIRISYKC